MKLEITMIAVIGGVLVGCVNDEPILATRSDTVIGGTQSAPGAWPWQAQLQLPGEPHVCGGVLVAPQWVLTARHCLVGSPFNVVLGEHNRTVNENTEQQRAVDRVVPHPDSANDIALLHLAQPAALNARVNTINLASGNDGPGLNAVISGWGRTAAGSPAAPVLMQATLPVVANAACNSAPNIPRDLNANELCAGFLDGNRGGCQGDSGGPFVVQRASGAWDLIGIVSRGSPTCDTFSVFARVSSHRRWITGVRMDDIVWQHNSGQVHYWSMSNGQSTGGFNVGTPIGSDWHLRGVGDVNGDGNQDIIWQHDSGQVHYWRMSNGQSTGGFHIGTPIGSDWHLRGVGDVNGDGTHDIIWQHDSGQVHYWRMSNGQSAGGFHIGTPIGADWHLRGVGDVNGNETDDIIWQHNNGQVHFWNMVNGQSIAGSHISAPVGPEWHIRAVADVNGNGTDDIIWQHNSGQVHFWSIVSGLFEAGVNVGTPVGSDWHLRGAGNLNQN